MKHRFVFSSGTFLAFLFLFSFFVQADGVVKTYPAPEGEAVTDLYSVFVDGKPVDVYAAQCEFFEGDYCFAYFDFSGKVNVEIRSKNGVSMNSTKILPESFGFQVSANENAASFEADKPFRVSVEPNGRVKPLLLFGNALETDVPNPSDPNVLYFGPGVHRVGKISVTSNQTLYIAGGAVVKGCIYASGENITIRGRGIVGGEESPRFQGPGRFLLDCKDCKNVAVHDLILRNPWSWTAVTWNCDGVLVDGLKICGSRMINDDALDLVNTQNAVVSNCFFRTQDDSIAVKGIDASKRPCENIRIENCQFWTDCANIYRIGYECDAEGMRNIVSQGIDVLHYSKNFRGPENYWANAIFWLQPNLEMRMETCSFEDVTVYSDGSRILMLMAKPMRCMYGKHKKPEPGMLENCTFKNLRVIGEKGDFEGQIFLLGESPKYSVSGLVFENVQYFGTPVTPDSECVKIGENVENTRFQ